MWTGKSQLLILYCNKFWKENTWIVYILIPTASLVYFHIHPSVSFLLPTSVPSSTAPEPSLSATDPPSCPDLLSVLSTGGSVWTKKGILWKERWPSSSPAHSFLQGLLAVGAGNGYGRQQCWLGSLSPPPADTADRWPQSPAKCTVLEVEPDLLLQRQGSGWG